MENNKDTVHFGENVATMIEKIHSIYAYLN